MYLLYCIYKEQGFDGPMCFTQYARFEGHTFASGLLTYSVVIGLELQASENGLACKMLEIKCISAKQNFLMEK